MKKTTRWGGVAMLALLLSMVSSSVAWSQCAYTLKLSDTYGDGWNGNTIDVKLGSVTTNYTLYDNFDTTIVLIANTGDSIALSYNASGLYQSEVSFELTDPSNISLYASGTSPTTGRVYDTTAVCPTCIAVTGMTQDSATSSTVSVSWPSTGAGMYSIEWGACGFLPNTGAGTIVSTANTNYTFSGLTPAQCIEVYITSDCSGAGNGLSVQSGPYAFVSNQNTVSTFPYLEDFESDNGGFLASGSLSSWEWGTPANTFIANAAGGVNAWVTDLDGDYPDNEASYLTTPILDLTSVTDGIQIAFDLIFETETNYDQAWLEISFDNGATWNKITDNGVTNNWYNEPTDEVWEGQNAGWTNSDIILDTVSGYSQLKIRFAFDSDGSSTREGVGIDNFEVNPLLCSLPTNISAINITTTSADITWTSTAAGSNIEWGPSGFTQGTGTFVYGNLTGTESISGLTPGMVYDVYVQDSCISGDVGIWRGPYTFTTEQATISALPYAESFEANTGGWIQYGTESDWEWGVPMGTYISSARQGQKAWVTNLSGDYTPNQMSYLQTPIFDLSAETGSFMMSFKLISEALDNDDAMWLEMTSDGGATWVKVVDNGSASNWYNELSDLTWTDTTGNWIESTFIFDTIAGYSSIQFRYAFDTDGFSNYEGFGIDEFNFEVLSCTVPSAVAIANITSTTADVSWTSGAAGVNIEWGPAGFGQGTGTFVYDASSPNGLSTLLPGTTYEVYLQDSCGVGNVGVWIGPYTFTTQQAVINTFPYVEGFEADAGGWIQDSANSTWEWGVPSGTLISSAAQGQKAWVTNLDGDYNNFENSYLRSVIFDCSALTNDIEYSFQMIFETENAYDEGWVEYSFDGTTWTKLIDNGVAVGWYNDVSNQWWEDDDGLVWIQRSNVIPGSAGQSFVQLRHFMSSDVSNTYEGFAIDDVRVEELSCAVPSALGATNITTSSADAFWLSSGTEWNVEYGPQGFSPLTGVGTVVYSTNDTLTLSSLTQNMCYDVYVQDSCLGGNSVWIGPYTFCTLPTCPAPTNLDTVNVTDVSATLNWTGNNTTGDYQVQYGINGFVLGNGTFVSSTTESLALTNLNPASSYCYYVREICTVGDTSDWAGPFCFNTQCGAFLGDDYTSPIVVSGGSPYVYLGSNTLCYTNALALRPGIDVVFEYTASAGATSASFETCGSGFDTWLFFVDASQNTINDNDDACGTRSQLLNEPVTPGTTYYVVVEGYSASSLGNFTLTITENIPCSPPTAITASNETCSEIELNWTATDPAASFDIEYGAPNFGLGNGTMINSVDSTEVLTGLTPGTPYEVYVRTICASGDTSSWTGPIAISTIAGTAPSASATFSISSVTLTEATVDFDGTTSVADSIAWDFGDGSPIEYGDTPSHDYTANGTYTVRFVAITACGTDLDSVTVNITGISVEENVLNAFNVYPNPTTGNITIELEEMTGNNANIQLTDLQGRILEDMKVDLSANGRTIQMDLSSLPKGVYMLRFRNESATQVERIVLK